MDTSVRMLATAAAALSLSGLLLVWVLRREAVLQTQRRAEDLLAAFGSAASGLPGRAHLGGNHDVEFTRAGAGSSLTRKLSLSVISVD
jgi:hypothetical protein